MSLEFLFNYKVISKIGEGSFSDVLKVEDKKTGTKYAAKILKRFYQNEEEVLTCSEIQSIKTLETHPNVVGIVDIICDKFPGYIALIFELMDMSMYDYIKNRKRCLSELKVKSFTFQLVCGLQHLHSNGIFHRDIKPENILIKLQNKKRIHCRETEVVQLADLGSVCRINQTPPHTSYISTRWYRAPECLLTSGYYGSKMDIWSIGCVYYEMLTLLPLFPGDNELDQLHKIHEIIGSPTSRILTRFKHRNVNYNFPKQNGIGFYNLVPILSEKGIDVLKRTLSYHPDMRIDVYRLMDHVYFDDLRTLRSSQSNYSSASSFISCGTRRTINSNNSTKTLKYSKDSNHSSSKTKINSCATRSLDSWMTSQNRNSGIKHSIMKQKERAWGMNPGAAKIALIKNITASQRRK